MKTALALLLTLLIIACQEAAQPVPQAPLLVPAPPMVTAEEPPMPAVEKVSIVRFTFIPETIRIKAGDMVQWVNQDSTSHSVKLLGSPPGQIMAPGETYELTLTDKGTYQYSCGIHAKMQGTIIVW